MRKKFLAFGSLVVITTPIMTVVACAEEKSDIEKEADKVQNTTSTFKGEDIKTNIAGIKAGRIVTEGVLGITGLFNISPGYSVEYYLISDGNDYDEKTDLQVKAKVVKDDDKENTFREKPISIKPFVDSIKPTIQAKDVAIGKSYPARITNDNNGEKGTLEFQTNTTEVTKKEIQDAFLILDNYDKKISETSIKVAYEWSDNAPKENLDMTEGVQYTLTIKATDSAGNESKYLLTITVIAAPIS